MRFLKLSKNKEYTDAELIQQFRETKDNAFVGILFERYSHLVFGLCLKYLKNEDEAKDAVLSIFEKLLVDLLRHNINSFKSWLYMVAKNFCLMEIRDKKEIDRHETTDLHAEINVEAAAEAEKNEKKIEHLNAAIKELNEEQRACVELFFLHDKCYNEIAEITGYDMKKVKSHLQNGKRNLKIILMKKHESEFTT
jgi:RNA polymerase sigma factor (sigma-70 family)